MKKYAKKLLFLLAVFLFLLQAVPAKAADVKLTVDKISLIPGESYQLTAENTMATIKWSTNRKKVAKVNSTGNVTAVSPGTAIITANIDGKKYRCTVTVRKTVDIIVFAGQSNMTGVGNYYQAPQLTQGAGYMFNYVTNRKYFPVLHEPFGYGQDDKYFANGDYCKGSMVTAFVNAYYQQTNTPVIAVPAACVGTGSVSWKDTRYKGVIQRLKGAIKLAQKSKLKVRHVYMVWMQGENDACADMSAAMHKNNLQEMYDKIRRKTPVEQCLVIKIANYTRGGDWEANFKRIQKAQQALCRTSPDFTMISTKATTLGDSYFREDGIHIIQNGLNQIGTHAGKRAGRYANSH